MSPNTVCLRVWGDYACFTRPEMKVERVSYDVMTPSAARGVLEQSFGSRKSSGELRKSRCSSRSVGPRCGVMKLPA